MVVQLLWTAVLVSLIGHAGGVAHCDPSCETCEFWLNIESRLTMMQPNDGGLVIAKRGALYPYDAVGKESRRLDMHDVVTADGWTTPRTLHLINGTLPGPTLVVYEGQKLIVHVKNGLLSESISIHFHGLWQTDTPWMDGAAFITQCPILAGQRFTYRFKVRQHGTYWYHSHIGLQIPMGMYGAFIIRQRKGEAKDRGPFIDPPAITQQTHARQICGDCLGREDIQSDKKCVCGDWTKERHDDNYEEDSEPDHDNDEDHDHDHDHDHDDHDNDHDNDHDHDHDHDNDDHDDHDNDHDNDHGNLRFNPPPPAPAVQNHEQPLSDGDLGTYDTQQEFVMTVASYNHEWDAMTDFLHMYQGIYVNGTLMESPRAYDGAAYSPEKFNSVLINGRGRYRDPTINRITEPPLYTFKVRRDSWVRFRLIGVEAQFPFEVSIDDHMLYAVALDGQKIENKAVHSVVISPGERVDFFILARQYSKNYWIRAIPMVANRESESNYGEAILSYTDGGSNTHLSDSDPRQCTWGTECLVLNCPFAYFPKDMHKSCVHVDDLRAPEDVEIRHADRQIFLNFMLHARWSRLFSINGRSLLLPSVAALVQPHQTPPKCSHVCREKHGHPSPCRCYNTIKLEYGETVQMVLSNLGEWNRAVHPIHMHGHHFRVLKIGHGLTDPVSGQLYADNEDLVCNGDDPDTRVGCTDPKWNDDSWHADDIPGLNLHDPPLKDTIVVPSGGYVVIRFTAKNPGLWFMHCHTSAHYVSGMALVIEEALDKMPDPPDDFPKCGDYG